MWFAYNFRWINTCYKWAAGDLWRQLTEGFQLSELRAPRRFARFDILQQWDFGYAAKGCDSALSFFHFFMA